jgi:hypothetical protein
MNYYEPIMNQNVQTSSGAEPASDLKDTGGSFPWDKVTISLLYLDPRLRMNETVPLLPTLPNPNLSSWHAQEQLNLYIYRVLGCAVKRWWSILRNYKNLSADCVSLGGDLNQ